MKCRERHVKVGKIARCALQPLSSRIPLCTYAGVLVWHGLANDLTKCDEKRPCGNCIRRSDSCSLDISSSSRRLESQPLPRNTSSFNDARRRSNDRTSPHDTLPAAAHYLDSAFQSSITGRTSSIKKLLVSLIEEISSLDQEISCHSEARLPRGETSIPNSSVVWETSPGDWMRDLQLFHHYCSATCMTLACNTSIHHVWRDVVPQTACSHVS